MNHIKVKDLKAASNSNPIIFGITKGKHIALNSEDLDLARKTFLVAIGLLPPFSGNVKINSNVSWPIGDRRMLDAILTFNDHIDFINSIYSEKITRKNFTRKSIFKVLRARDINLNSEIRSESPYIRNLYAHAIALLLNFDVYAFIDTKFISSELARSKDSFISKKIMKLSKSSSMIFCNPSDIIIDSISINVLDIKGSL